MGGIQSKKLSKKLETNEIEKITALFNDISVTVKGNKIVDRDGFKRFHMIPEPLSDRIFALFEQKESKKQIQQMSLDDLIAGLAVLGKSIEKDKIDLIFKFLDIDDDGVISKEELSVLSLVALEGANSPNLNQSSNGNKTTPSQNNNSNSETNDAFVTKFTEMGYPKGKVNAAIKLTFDSNTPHASDGHFEKVLNWLDQHQSDSNSIDIDEEPFSNEKVVVSSPIKPDPKTIDELTVGLHLSTILTTFESLFDNPMFKDSSSKIQIKQFRKWATASKKPIELDSLLKPMSALYDRALKWKQPSIQRSTELLERSISQKEFLDTTISNNNNNNKDGNGSISKKSSKDMNPKELKRFSSVSVIDALRSSNSKENLKDTTPTKKDKKDSKEDKLDSKSNTTLKDTSNSITSPTMNSSNNSTFSKKDSTSTLSNIIEEKPTTTTTTTTTTTSNNNIKDKDLSSSFDSDDSDDSDGESLKPAIQVVIRDKPIELQKTNSLFNIDSSIEISKPSGLASRSQTLKMRGTRASNRYTIDPDIFKQPLNPSFSAPIQSTQSKQQNSNNMSGGIPLSPPINVSMGINNSSNNSINKISNSNSNLSDNISSNDGGGSGSFNTPTQSRLLNRESIDQMKNCIQYLENGEFYESIQELDKCIKTLLNLHSGNHQSIQNEINFLIGYKVALNILIHIKTIESQLNNTSENLEKKRYYLEQLSLLSKLLVDIPLQNNHRVVCAKMAIQYNMISENYGIASNLLEVLNRNNHLSNTYDEMIQKCKENQLKNSNLPLYICPTCRSRSATPEKQSCSTCNRVIRWCFQTFQIITDQTFLACNYCNSTFSIDQNEIEPNKNCNLCFHGSISHK